MRSIHSLFIFLSQFIHHYLFHKSFRVVVLLHLLVVLGGSLLLARSIDAAGAILSAVTLYSMTVLISMVAFFFLSNKDNESILLRSKNEILRELGSRAERIREKVKSLDEMRKQYLENEKIPQRLCCSISQGLMHFPVKGEDGYYYDQLLLAQYYYHEREHGRQPYYRLNLSLKINDPFDLEIDMKKYMEIQNYIRSVRYRKSTSKEMAQDAMIEGIKVAGVAFLMTKNFTSFSHLRVIFSSVLGFLGGIGLYFHARYAVQALESVREEMEAARNASSSSGPIEHSSIFNLGKSASHGFFPYFKSWVPSFDRQNDPYTNPKEWYAGFREGIEEDEMKNHILYEYEFPKLRS